MIKKVNVKATIFSMVVLLCFSFSLHGIGCLSVKKEKVFNHYKKSNGGYIAVYTRNKKHGMYSAGGNIYVAGLIRVMGKYKNDGHFYPKRPWYKKPYSIGANITQDKDLKKLAKKYLPEVTDGWFGGDTRGFFYCKWYYKPQSKV